MATMRNKPQGVFQAKSRHRRPQQHRQAAF